MSEPGHCGCRFDPFGVQAPPLHLKDSFVPRLMPDGARGRRSPLRRGRRWNGFCLPKPSTRHTKEGTRFFETTLPPMLELRLIKLRIHHRTIYRFHRRVSFGPHRLMLRPRESRNLRLISSNVTVDPAAVVTWAQDVSGNAVATATFQAMAARAGSHSIRSTAASAASI
jgi:hypothetical protein